MSQKYIEIQNTDVVSESIDDIIINFDTLKTNFSDTFFPTTNLSVGMQCYRTDLKKMYILESISPLVWKESALDMLTRNKAYIFGDIVRSGNLKSFEYLKCVTAGTTALVEPSLTSMYIQDGGVKWLKSAEPLATYARDFDSSGVTYFKVASFLAMGGTDFAVFLSLKIKLQDNNRSTSVIQVDISTGGHISRYTTGDSYKLWGNPINNIQITTYIKDEVTSVYLKKAGIQRIYEIEYNWHLGNARDTKTDGLVKLSLDHIPEGTLVADSYTGVNCIGSMSIDGRMVMTNKDIVLEPIGTDESKFYPIAVNTSYGSDLTFRRHVHQQSQWKGACILVLRGQGYAWGGDAPYIDYTYSNTGNITSKNPVGSVQAGSRERGIIVWLRGGFQFNLSGCGISISPLTKVDEDTYTSHLGDTYNTLPAPANNSGLAIGKYHDYSNIATSTISNAAPSRATNGAIWLDTDEPSPPNTVGLPIGSERVVGYTEVDFEDIPLLGGLYSKTVYKDLWDWVQTKPSMLLTEAQWQVKKTENGGVGVPYYSRGTDTEFRVPLKDVYIRGANSINEVGTYLGDAIRNIVGEFKVRGINGGIDGVSGCVEVTGNSTGAVGNVSTASVGGHARIDSSLVVPTAEENRPKTIIQLMVVRAIGSVSNVGSTDVAELITSVRDLSEKIDNEVGMTIIYPNGGTEGNPASVTVNSRYVLDNPFPNYNVICTIELFINNIWSTVGSCWDANTGGGIGCKVFDIGSNKLAIQTGSKYLTFYSTALPNGFGNTGNINVPTICRVKVWKCGRKR